MSLFFAETSNSSRKKKSGADYNLVDYVAAYLFLAIVFGSLSATVIICSFCDPTVIALTVIVDVLGLAVGHLEIDSVVGMLYAF